MTWSEPHHQPLYSQQCDSEYIVGYKGSFQKGNSVWIVMEYCGGGSLCDLIAICDRVRLQC
jgi:serine/threonine protein kinase